MRKAEKTFRLIEEGDKIYRMTIMDSTIQNNDDGDIVSELTIDKIQQWRDFYTLRLTLSDKTHVEVNSNNTYAVVAKKVEDTVGNRMAINADFYSTTKRGLLDLVMGRLDEHSKKMCELMHESGRLFGNCYTTSKIINKTISLLPEEEPVLTEEEFASIAL